MHVMRPNNNNSNNNDDDINDNGAVITVHYFATIRGVQYCDQCVCMSVNLGTAVRACCPYQGCILRWLS